MNEDAVNMEIRKFLKRFGVAAQRVIEEAARKAGSGMLDVRATLQIEGRPDAHVEREEIPLG